METSIGFDTYDCLKNMTGVGQLPLVVSPTITNDRLYHVLIDGGAALNLISLDAFRKVVDSHVRAHPFIPVFGGGPRLYHSAW
jgi:hypothetical protein